MTHNKKIMVEILLAEKELLKSPYLMCEAVELLFF